MPEEFLEKGFKYPESYIKIIELNLVDFDYWYIISEEQALKRLTGLRQRYPERYLVPFARSNGNDGIACFDVSEPEKIQIIHDFASNGYEQMRTYEDLWEWLQEAINELIVRNR
jgi:hypothetical protein